MTTISFARHQFPPAVIRHAVWLYSRFTLSYRDVEELRRARSGRLLLRWPARGNHMRVALSAYALTSLLMLAACDAQPGPAGAPGPQGPPGPQGAPGAQGSAIRVITTKAKADCNADEIMISAYCSASPMRPSGTSGASCAYDKADIVVTCMKR